MLLLGLMVLVLLAGVIVMALALKSTGQRRYSFWGGCALLLEVFALLWIAAFVFPGGARWAASAGGTFLVVVLGVTWTKRFNVLSFILGLAGAAVFFHFSLALFEVAMSTRAFESDQELLNAAFKRGVSLPSISQLTVLLALVGVGGLAGQLVGARLRRRL